MIQIEDLTKGYGHRSLLENASIRLNKGERVALIGRNGSGKSTLFQMILEKEPADKGTITYPKDYLIGYLEQHLNWSEKTLLEEGALALDPDKREETYRVEKILFGLGFSKEDMKRPPEAFSGGYQLRLHLAKVLLAEPDCLLLDEPTNYLDIVSIRWLERFLRNWQSEMILISHDRSFLNQVITHTLGIHRNKLIKIQGSTDRFFEHILQDEQVHERTRQGIEKKRRHAESFIERFGSKATKAKQAQSRAKMLEKIPVLEQLVELHDLSFQFHEAPFQSKKHIQASNIDFSYTGDPLIQDFSLTVETHDRIAIIGKNGKGKSTLLNLLNKELTPLKGELTTSPNTKAGSFGQTHISYLHPDHTIEEEILAANPTLSYSQSRKICGIMLFSQDDANKPIRVLSGGEKSRVLLGKILAKPCNLLFLDEPTHHLDLESIESLIHALKAFSGTYIFVTHNEDILRTLPFNKLIICKEHEQIQFSGSYNEFLEKIGWEEEGILDKKSASSKNKKLLRQQRAQTIQQRAEHLKPIKKQISQVEKQITKIEIECEQMQQTLIKYANNNNNLKIATTSKEIGLKKAQLDTLYKQLETFFSQIEEIEQQFN